jgi:hypothetical protein
VYACVSSLAAVMQDDQFENPEIQQRGYKAIYGYLLGFSVD